MVRNTQVLLQRHIRMAQLARWNLSLFHRSNARGNGIIGFQMNAAARPEMGSARKAVFGRWRCLDSFTFCKRQIVEVAKASGVTLLGRLGIWEIQYILCGGQFNTEW
ncbi:hypothetical protein N657DRAFT_235936 [Parathielavia appendiculata]|uniref:Uncharacterized protein n=1 Tax=Parathielavia appendiculata TaxID=2587402 RepID=A0AAN6Z7I7_9PEZI|nr:hypothetical protein N657DRAFT_235936 [Parathielavia appendiculata]